MQSNYNSQNSHNPNGQTFLRGLLGEPTKAKASGVAFSLATILPQILAVVFVILTAKILSDSTQPLPDWYLYFNYLLPQISFALTAFFFLRYTRTPIKTAFEKQKCPSKYYLVAVCLQIGLLSLSWLNGWFLEFLGQFGYEDSGILLPSMDGFGFVGVLLVVAALPAIFEEIMFRGVLLSGLRSFGKTGAVLLCGALFAIYHQNPAQTIYQFCCGAAFALVALRSGSILPTVLAHFLNNAAILTLAKFGIEEFPTPVSIVFLIVSAVCLLGSLVYLVFIDKTEKVDTNGVENTPKQEKKRFFFAAAAGIAVCAVIWVSALFLGM